MAGALGVSLVACLLLVPAVEAQSKPDPQPPAQAETPKDTLGRSTPRGAVRGFLTAARKGDYRLARQYLNTRLRDREAVDLAHKLFAVLDSRLSPRLRELSDRPEGSLANPLKPDQDATRPWTSMVPPWTSCSNASSSRNSALSGCFRHRRSTSYPRSTSRSSRARRPWPSLDSSPTHECEVFPSWWLALLVGFPLLYLAIGLLNRLHAALPGHLTPDVQTAGFSIATRCRHPRDCCSSH